MPAVAGVAQLVEQWFCKPQVGGSTPSAGTILNSFHARSVQAVRAGRAPSLAPELYALARGPPATPACALPTLVHARRMVAALGVCETERALVAHRQGRPGSRASA